MSSEQVDIVVQETGGGSRVIRRNFDELGLSAEQLQGKIDALQGKLSRQQQISASLQAEVARLTAGQANLGGALDRSATAAAAFGSRSEELRDLVAGIADGIREEAQAHAQQIDALEGAGTAAELAEQTIRAFTEALRDQVAASGDAAGAEQEIAAALAALGGAAGAAGAGTKSAAAGLAGIGQAGSAAAGGMGALGQSATGVGEGLAGVGEAGAGAGEGLAGVSDGAASAGEALTAVGESAAAAASSGSDLTKALGLEATAFENVVSAAQRAAEAQRAQEQIATEGGGSAYDQPLSARQIAQREAARAAARSAYETPTEFVSPSAGGGSTGGGGGGFWGSFFGGGGHGGDEFGKAAAGARGAAHEVNGLASSLRKMRQEGFLVNLLSRQMGELGLATGATGKAFGVMALAAGGMMGPLLAIEGAIAVVAAVREHFAEVVKIQAEARKQAREFGDTLVTSIMEAQFTWDRFKASLSDKHLSEAGRLLAEQLAEIQHKTQETEVRLRSVRQESEENAAQRGEHGGLQRSFIDSWLLPLQQLYNVGRAMTDRRSEDDRLQEIVHEAAKGQFAPVTHEEIQGAETEQERQSLRERQAGYEAVLRYTEPRRETLATGLRQMHDIAATDETRELGKETVRLWLEGAKEAARGAAFQAGQGAAEELSQHMQAPERARETEAISARYWSEERRARMEAAHQLQKLDEERQTYAPDTSVTGGQQLAQRQAALEGARDIAVATAKQKALDEEHAMESRAAQVMADERTKIAMAGEVELSKKRGELRIAESAKGEARDPVRIRQLEEEIRLTQTLASAETRRYDRQLRETLDPALAATRKEGEEATQIRQAQAAGNLGSPAGSRASLAEMNRLLEANRARYQDLRDPIQAVVREHDREAASLQYVGDEREIQKALLDEEEKARKRGASLYDAETGALNAQGQALRDSTARRIEANRVGQEAQAIYETTRGAAQRYAAQLEAIARLEKEGTISATEAALARKNAKRETDPRFAFAEELRKEVEVTRQIGDAREVETRWLAYKEDLERRNIVLQQGEEASVRQRIALQVEENKLYEAKASLLEKYRGPQDQLRRGTEAANQLEAEGALSPRQAENERMGLRLNAGQGDFSDGFLKQLGLMENGAQQFAARTGAVFADLTTGIAQGFGDATARALVFGDDVGDALGDMARNALAGVLSSLIQIGVQFAIDAALSAALGKGFQSKGAADMAKEIGLNTAAALGAGAALTAAAAIEGPIVAAAWSPAAAMVSLATFGGNAGPAMAGITATTALAAAMSKVGAAGAAAAGGGMDLSGVTGADVLGEFGGSPVPGYAAGGFTGHGPTDEEAGIVHREEFVSHAEATRRNRPLLEALNRGEDPVTAIGHGYQLGGYVGASALSSWQPWSRGEGEDLRKVARESLTTPAAPAKTAGTPSVTMNVRVENHVSDRVTARVEQLSPTDVLVLIEEHAPKAVARDLYRGPSGTTATALRKTHKVEPVR